MEHLIDKRKSKSKGSNFRVYVATSFPHATFCEIEKLASDFQLGKAEVVRFLFLRGLEAYHSDGVLSHERHSDLVEARRRFALVSVETALEASPSNS